MWITLTALQGQHEGIFLRFSRRSLDAAIFLQVPRAKGLEQACLGIADEWSVNKPRRGR
jgi:hypothetical protein